MILPPAGGFTELTELLPEPRRSQIDRSPYVLDRLGRIWVRPDPIDFTDKLRARYVAMPGKPEAIAITLGLKRLAEFVAGTVMVQLAFDDGSEATSDPAWIEVCASDERPTHDAY